MPSIIAIMRLLRCWSIKVFPTFRPITDTLTAGPLSAPSPAHKGDEHGAHTIGSDTCRGPVLWGAARHKGGCTRSSAAHSARTAPARLRRMAQVYPGLRM